MSEIESAPLNLLADKAALALVCRRHNIQRLSLFGSRLKNTADFRIRPFGFRT